MTDQTNPAPPVPQDLPHKGILDKTLGEIIQNNQQAQGMIMKAMHISPEKLQEMLKATGSHEMMNMTIRDMFSNGIIQQAATGKVPVQTSQGQTVQVTPEQMQQLMQAAPNGEPITPEQFQQITGQAMPLGQMQAEVSTASGQPQNESFLHKLKKGLFG